MAIFTLGQVEVDRAVGVIELEVGQTTTVEAPVVFPTRPSLEFPELQMVITGQNAFAIDYHWAVRSQNATTGRVTIDLINDTAGAPGSMGEFRVEMLRTKG